MRISGLVVYLTPDATDTTPAVLSGHDAIDVGELIGQRLPLVIEADDEAAERDLRRWIAALPGVRLVTLAYVHYGDMPEAGPESVPQVATAASDTEDRR